MKKVYDLKQISEMNDDEKKLYTDYLLSTTQQEIKNYLQTNKTYIKEILTSSNAKIFEKEVLKKGHLEESFLQHILERLDKDHFEKFQNKTLKAVFKPNKKLAKAIVEEKEYNEDELVDFLFDLDEEKKKKALSFFVCIGLVIDDISEKAGEAKESDVNSDLKAELAQKEKRIKELEKQTNRLKSDNEKKISVAESERKIKKATEAMQKKVEKAEKEVRQKAEEIKNIKENLDKADKELQHAKKELKEIKGNKSTEEVKKIIANASAEKKVAQEVIVASETEEKRLRIDFDSSLMDLESRTLLGVVKAEDIQLEKSWIIVHPIVPIISENSNIDREKFVNEVDYRSDYSSFVLYINQQLLDSIFSRDKAEDFQFLTNDEKYNLLFETFCRKVLFFAPQFVEKANGKRKLNARLIDNPVPFEDFNNSTFVPSFDGTKAEFEKIVKNHDDLVLINYPYSLSSYLRYVCVGDTIYEINYVPNDKNTDDGNASWRFNAQIDNSPYRKLGIKINRSEFSDKYILTPDINSDRPSNLYVKNIAFIEASTNTSTIFDEDDFITAVSKNAKSENLYYTSTDLKNFHIALKSSNLVILAGPSGIGKTRLPIVYANALGLDFAKKTLLFVPISPSYLEPEDVLGYVRPINTDGFDAEYMESQTGLVSFLIDAEEHKDKIHMVIFDEMNLSQIEHWFAPFISILEQDPDSRTLNLYSENLSVKNGDAYPHSINIGKNVFFVGTINIDETTKQISDRLLDRAIVINLAMPSFAELKGMGTANTEIYPEITFSRYATSMKQVNNSTSEFKDDEFALINDLNALFMNSVANKSISFRSLRKMAIYLKNSTDLLSRKEAFDFVVAQIVVKKLTGSREELDEIISDDDTLGILKVLNDHNSVSDFAQTKKVVQQKIQELNKYGFTR